MLSILNSISISFITSLIAIFELIMQLLILQKLNFRLQKVIPVLSMGFSFILNLLHHAIPFPFVQLVLDQGGSTIRIINLLLLLP